MYIAKRGKEFFIQSVMVSGPFSNLKMGQIIGLNQTAKFLYDNCDGKTLAMLCDELIKACTMNDSLDKTAVKRDCEEAMDNLHALGLIEMSSEEEDKVEAD